LNSVSEKIAARFYLRPSLLRQCTSSSHSRYFRSPSFKRPPFFLTKPCPDRLSSFRELKVFYFCAVKYVFSRFKIRKRSEFSLFFSPIFFLRSPSSSRRDPRDVSGRVLLLSVSAPTLSSLLKAAGRLGIRAVPPLLPAAVRLIRKSPFEVGRLTP